MGSLELPSAGLIYIDSSGLIYSVERVEPYRSLLEPMWEQAQSGSLTIISSPILVIETLMKPIRDGNIAIEAQYRELFASNAISLFDVSYATVEDAAVRAPRRASRPPTPSMPQRLSGPDAPSSSPTTTISAASRAYRS